MVKSAQWVVSEAGLAELNAAGITTAWLKAWLLSAGATTVAVDLLESATWQAPDVNIDVNGDVGADVEWQVFFASSNELQAVAEHYDYHDLAQTDSFRLENPPRQCHSFIRQSRQVMLLPLGDIAYQRQNWLRHLKRGCDADAETDVPLLPLYVRADHSLPLALEVGLSASLEPLADDNALNASILNTGGWLIEEQVIALLKRCKHAIRTVESCTAGGIAARLCRMPGASDVVDRAWVTYSNAAKSEMLGVDVDLVVQYGAVSEEVVRAMAEGGVDSKYVCLAVSGIAGPGGGTVDKPVGTVWIAVALNGQDTVSQCLRFTGSRSEIQARTVIAALQLLIKVMQKL